MKKNSHYLPFLSLVIVLALLLSGCKILGSEEKEEKVKVEPLAYSPYSGYWEVDLSAGSESSAQKPSATQNIPETLLVASKAAHDQPDHIMSNGYFLKFYKPSSWSSYIPLSTSGSTTYESDFGYESDITYDDDEIYLSYAVINTGSETFSYYLDSSHNGEVTIIWDGEEYDTIPIEMLQSNQYEMRKILIQDFYSDVDLSPGIHKVELVLDVFGQSPQTIERTIEIEAPDIMAETFEFTESMYFIESNGSVTYGNLSFSNSTLTLHGYGSLEIIEDNGNEMIVEVSVDGVNKQSLAAGFQIGLQRQQPSIQDTKMTNLLCHDPWTLIQTTSTQTPEGEQWMFHRSGNYDFINTSAGLSRKAWGYDSETTINYGFSRSQLNGTTEILELTQDYMVMDDGFNIFEFER